MPSREEEPRRRKKEFDREYVTTQSSDKGRLPDKLHRKRSSTSREGDTDHHRNPSRLARSSISDLPFRSSKQPVMAVPEMERRSSAGESRASSYPSFSKAHSKEAVGRREELGKANAAVLTPEATDIGREDRASVRRARNGGGSSASRPDRAPPSPPLTADEADMKRSQSGNSQRGTAERVRSQPAGGHKSAESPLGGMYRYSSSGSSPRKSPKKSPRQDSGSDASTTTDPSKASVRMREPRSSQSQGNLPSHMRPPAGRNASDGSLSSSTITQSTEDSQATSIATERKAAAMPPPPPPAAHRVSPLSRSNSSHQTPMPQDQTCTQHDALPRMTSAAETAVNSASPRSYGATALDTPGPPPPPPPIMFPPDVPRVDYLLQNGGLPYLIPRVLISAASPAPVQSYQQYASPRLPQAGQPHDVSHIFLPISKRLEDFARVLSKDGSVAVATGYRSVARRLLDRLEHVFARNISSEKCECVVCNVSPQPQLSEEEDTGLSWGEILEFVSGRRELPQWPPFSLSSDAPGLGITSEQSVPMQRLDPDVPAEYREHYLRQNVKTQRTVQEWLSQQPDVPSSPPQQVDDETLSFAMLTHLEPERRPFFTAIMKGQSSLPTSRAPTPVNADTPKSPVLPKTALALQRLYRLSSLPRDPECTIYLLNNQHLHSMLATLAAVSPGEWEILVSGRFDGFLWSGAETPLAPSASTFGSQPPSRGPSRGPLTPMSRTTTPFSPLRNLSSPSDTHPSMAPSRNATPAPSSSSDNGLAPAPVQLDEETEIAVLAEVEREIYLGMERLEDQFELMHRQAELLGQQLRERSAGLIRAAAARRGALASDVEVRMGTPASGVAGVGGWGNGVGGINAGLDDGEAAFLRDLDGRSELAPDDSASNVSYGRRSRRPKRQERFTPALVEEDEDVGGGAGLGVRHRR